MKRRDCIKLSALGAAGIACSDVLEAAEPKPRRRVEAKNDRNYSVVVIGDLHYDKLPAEVYHEGYSDPSPEREANHRKEFVRNDEMWKKRMRELLRRASRLRGEDTRMTIQVGDLIQGDCGDAANHKILLDDAWCYVKGAVGGLPLVTVAGNHDLRGRDDKEVTEAYREYMSERMSEELGKPIAKTCFYYWIGKDAYIVVDFTNPDDEEIDRMFNETLHARYTFVIIHSPVIPYQHKSWANWIIHGRDNNAEARRHFRRLLAERNAIVICGHTHTTEYALWEGDGGSISQVTVNSVWKNASSASYNVISSNPDDWGAVVLMGGSDAMKDLIKEYKDGIRAFSIASSCGSYKLLVSDKGVKMEYYAGASEDVTEVFTLR